MRIHGRKQERKKDAGNTYVETMAAMAIGMIILGGGAVLYMKINDANTTASALQSKKAAISDTLNRTTQAVQVADPILLASPTELVIERKDGSGAVMRTRWVKNGTVLYMQTWTGPTTGYPSPSSTAWIDPTIASAPAPNGDGMQSSTRAVTDVTNDIYTYLDKDANTIPIVGGVANPLQIRRVDVNLQANAMSGNKAPVSNETKVAVRNGEGGYSDGSIAAPTCPAVTIDPSSTTIPTLNWGTIAGVTTYEIHRDGNVATTVNVPAGQPQGTWTEAAGNVTPGQTINYQILAKDGTGTLSASCRTTTWRVQVATPVFQDSTVLPRGTEASSWSAGADAGLTQPRIAMKWGAVPGATGYQLFYRRLDAAGNPTPDASEPFTLMTGSALSAATTSYSWDGASWGTRYEWFVKATSKTGQSNDSRHVQILTHPKTPLNVTISPAYGTGADTTVNGYNNLTWDPAVSADRYEVWRYDSGNSGTSSLAGTTVGTTFTDTVPYGTTYTYYVVAKNFGPRGTDAAGADVTAFRASPNPESSVSDASNGNVGVSYQDGSASNKSGVYYGNTAVTTTRASVSTVVPNPTSPKPKTATVLQYPPIPSVSAPSLAGFATRDLDGSNRLVWAPAQSATGYQVTRITVSGASQTCLTSADCKGQNPGISATSFTDPAAKGSQWVYGVQAMNATGYSVKASLGVSLTQRPPAPPLNVTQTPSLTSSNSGFTTTANADAGNSGADKFCTMDTCSYQVLRNGAPISTLKHQQSGAVVAFNNAPNPDGSTLTWTARSQNGALTNGGWSDPTATIVNTYPGTFGVNPWIGDSNGNQRSRFIVNLTNTDIVGSSVASQQVGWVTVAWGNPAGSSSVRMRRIPVANDSTSADGSKGLPGPGAPDITYGGGQGSRSDWAAPGATYAFQMTATAPNGLQRQVTTPNLNTPPDLPRHGTTIITCAKPTYSNTNPAGHLQATRLQDFQAAPLYGTWARVNVAGLTWAQGGGPSVTTNHDYYPADGPGDWISGPGAQYYYGLTSGFDVTTVSANAGNSVTIRQQISAYSSFHDGCAPDGSYWWDLKEPVFACYGYDPANGTCYTNNPQNRPQWQSK